MEQHPGADDAQDFELEVWLTSLTGPPPVVQAGARVLRRRSREIPARWFGTQALANLVEVMVETMRRAPGVGLAAPQIGIPWRLFVAEDPEERVDALPTETRSERGRIALPLTVVANPSLVVESSEEVTFFEGCLSVRGYAALVPRWKAVKLVGLDVRGRPVEHQLVGWPARIAQHETDHLDGTLYVDRMISRSLAGEAELPRLSGMSVSEVVEELVTVEPK